MTGATLPALFALFLSVPLIAHKEKSQITTPEEKAAQSWQGVGVDEKPGKKIPGDVVFTDEHGRVAPLSSRMDRPTLLVLVFYSCTQSCAVMLGNLSIALAKMPLTLGKDYRVLTLSIDETETPEAALTTKRAYLKNLPAQFGDSAWQFLTGDSASIRQLADAIGFRFRKTAPREFIHPNVLIALSRDGTIIRYLYGPDFLPFDMGMALTEAARGTPSLSVRKILSYCFKYDSNSKSYTFQVTQFIGIGAFLILGVILFVLLKKPRSGR